MVDRPPTEKELAEILAKFRRVGRSQIMSGGAVNKLANEFDLDEKEAEAADFGSEKPPAPDPKGS
ncbi:MAG: hypothetical protein HOH89_02990 [Alphaproteobacteria bacterium]|nr:hypothetical protein [Alphaproteobacteria bacterium]